MNIDIFKKICKKHHANLVENPASQGYSLTLDGVTVSATSQELFASPLFEPFQMLVYLHRCKRPKQPSVLAFERDFIHFDEFLLEPKSA